MSKGPWMILANNIKEALSKSDAMKDENEKMKEKIKEQNIAYVKLKKTSEDLEIIKDTLERKIAELELDSQKLTPLIAEKKRLEEKLSFIQGELGVKEKIINTLKDKIDKLETENKNIKKKSNANIKSMEHRGSARKSMLHNLLKKGGRNDQKVSIVDESAMNMVYELQEENACLKRSKLFKRMEKLSQSSTQFNKFIKQGKLLYFIF